MRGAMAPCWATTAGTGRLVQSARRVAPISLAIIEPHGWSGLPPRFVEKENEGFRWLPVSYQLRL
jgi:hypothetical protein